MPKFVKPGTIYSGITLDPMTSSFAKIMAPNVTYNALYQVLTLDVDEDSLGGFMPGTDSQTNDPKVYLRNPLNLSDQQYCGNFGSKVCPIKKSLSNIYLDLLVTCQGACRFTLKVTVVQLVNEVKDFTGTPRTFFQSDPLSFNVFLLQLNTTSGNVSSLTFQFDSDSIARTQIDLYYSY